MSAQNLENYPPPLSALALPLSVRNTIKYESFFYIKPCGVRIGKILLVRKMSVQAITVLLNRPGGFPREELPSRKREIKFFAEIGVFFNPETGVL